MFNRTRLISGSLLFIALLVVGFIYLLRGCLAKYDERNAIPPVLFFEKDGKAVLFSLVKFEKATSYSQDGGFINKSVSNSYYVQCNDANTGEKIKDNKITGHSRIKHYPMELIGASAGKAWLFIDELIAYDPFTLEKLADQAAIENKNPLLKGKLPIERQYYRFNEGDEKISFTAIDGSLWELNTQNLLALPAPLSPPEKIDIGDITFLSRRKNLQRLNLSFNEMKVNQDTIIGRWFGMYAGDELAELNKYPTITTAYGTDKRRQFVSGSYGTENSNKVINKPVTPVSGSNEYFLDGGFLLDKGTANPIHLTNPDSYLVVYKNQIGVEGHIVICRLTIDGRNLWTVDMNLKSVIDWSLHANKLYITGMDNKELSSSECNLLMNIDLQSGQVHRYDFFIDKTRK
jgi:hypothetical protein